MQDNIIKRRVTILAISVIVLLFLSPIGYMAIDRYIEGGNASFIDAFFWTVATITTMGHQKPWPWEVMWGRSIQLS